MSDLELTYSPYVNTKYTQFYEKHGYLPKYFNPYNCTELDDFAPTLTSQGDSITKSGTILIIEEVESRIFQIKLVKIKI